MTFSQLPEDDSIPSADDPRDFDPDDGIGIPLAALLQGLGAGGGGNTTQGRATGGGGAFTFSIGPGGNIIATNGNGNEPNQQQQQQAPPDLGQTLFRALGLAPPLRDPDLPTRGGGGGSGGAEDPEEEELPRETRDGNQNRNQVPIQNLAA